MLSRAVIAKAATLARAGAGVVARGRVVRVTGMVVEAYVEDAVIGEMVEIGVPGDVQAGRTPSRVAAEIVGFRDELALIVPLSELRGIAAGAVVYRLHKSASIAVSQALVGRVVDVFGRALDGGPPIDGADAVAMPVEAGAPGVETRAGISQRFSTSVRAIDGLLTLGRGQRVGIFAGAGVGKTVLLRQIMARSAADVTVIGLIGERGCEVHDLLEADVLGRSVVVAATSDRSPLERARGALTATAIAERFRAEGRDVLLVIDSLTRYAMALREIGLAAFEPPATKGYPPSVFAALPRLLERVAPLRGGGSMTAIYTVLVEGDDLADPVADSVRSLLDGHIVLSRELAARGHFPAIDVLASTSRVARQVTTRDEQALVMRAREVLTLRKEAEELRSLGAYTPGHNAGYDEALEIGAQLDAWLKQSTEQASVPASTWAELARALVRSRS